MEHLLNPHPYLSPENLALLNEDWAPGVYCTQIPTLEQARHLLGPSSDDVRVKRSQVYYLSKQMRARRRLPLGIHDRAEEYVFANGKIYEDDVSNVAKHLPVPLKVIRYKTYRIKKNEILDVTSSYRYWPELDHMHELYVYMYVNRLIVEPGAKIEVRGNVFVFCCDEIVVEREEPKLMKMTPQEPFDCQVSILGTPHFGFSSIRSMLIRDGRKGNDGCRGVPKQNLSGEIPSLFGPIYCAPPEANTEHSEDGEDGMDGEDGSNGANGGMAMLADIRIGKLTNFNPQGFRIFAQAESGYNGGNGGNGGKGGDGVLAGSGGNGGKGGDGGNGGLSSNIFVQIPKNYRQCVSAISIRSTGGQGGKGGLGGCHGNSYIESNVMPSPADGKNGKNGKCREGASIHFLP